MGVSQIAFLVLLAAVGLGRLVELSISRRNQARMRALGARPAPDFHFAWMVLWHGGWLLASALEVVLLRRPFLPALAVPMLVIFLFANGLRWWVIGTLGQHWNVQVMDSTALGVVTSGPYRWIRHPNYVAVLLEIVALPLIHACWVTAAAFAALTVMVIARRLKVEEPVLLANPAYRELMAHKKRFLPGVF